MSQASAVEVTGLSKRYGGKLAVDAISLRFERGSVAVVLGPNGAGKTTTIECCEGFRRPDSGQVRVLGLDPQADGTRLRPKIGIMLQSSGVYPSLHPLEVLHHLARLYAHPQKPEELIEMVGLSKAAKTPYRRLSGGERQRLGLAMALVGRPELVFLDEPTEGLDPEGRRAAWDLLADLRRDGVSVVMTTHMLDEAARLADQVVILKQGRLVLSGRPEELTQRGSPRTMRFEARTRLSLDGLSARLPSDISVREASAGTYLVEGPLTPTAVAAVMSWCAEMDVMPRDLSMGSRSLEDVYLEAVGQER